MMYNENFEILNEMTCDETFEILNEILNERFISNGVFPMKGVFPIISLYCTSAIDVQL